MDIEFSYYEFKNRMNNLLKKLGFAVAGKNGSVAPRFAGRDVLSDGETNALISKSIGADKGFMAARLGAVELNFIYNYQKVQKKGSSKGREEALRMLCTNAGFFPKDQTEADRLAQVYIDSMGSMDLCGAWGLFMEDYMLEKYAPDTAITDLEFLEPWNTKGDSPWSRELAGKKVLVIHPFVDTMEKQYAKRKQLFSNRFGENDILPEMDVKYLKAVQSIGGQGAKGFSSWFEAYEYMLGKIRETDFDVAILGCGAYGFPLAAEIRKMGKKAIHLGGATQLMFGIKGKRWDSNPDISRLYNEFWVSPAASEKPEKAEAVEGGCYW